MGEIREVKVELRVSVTLFVGRNVAQETCEGLALEWLEDAIKRSEELKGSDAEVIGSEFGTLEWEEG